MEKSIHDYYCYLCKKWHRYHDKQDKNRLINFHHQWKDKDKAEEQLRENKESERLHKLTFKH